MKQLKQFETFIVCIVVALLVAAVSFGAGVIACTGSPANTTANESISARKAHDLTIQNPPVEYSTNNIE
ncbi:MAG: hypothetical protein PHQ72_08460 [Hespellia sp.]|nr:hypothetical protein [Hespellia sp.]